MVRSIKTQLLGFRRHVAAQVLQRVWRGFQYRKLHGTFRDVSVVHNFDKTKPFWVKGKKINSELDMYHGPVTLEQDFRLKIASTSPLRPEPLPRRRSTRLHNVSST